MSKVLFNIKCANLIPVGAGHMAEGYARATGKPGVVLVTSGPGGTNTITPLQGAPQETIQYK